MICCQFRVLIKIKNSFLFLFSLSLIITLIVLKMFEWKFQLPNGNLIAQYGRSTILKLLTAAYLSNEFGVRSIDFAYVDGN